MEEWENRKKKSTGKGIISNVTIRNMSSFCTKWLKNCINIYVYFTTKVIQSQLQIKKNIKVTGQG